MRRGLTLGLVAVPIVSLSGLVGWAAGSRDVSRHEPSRTATTVALPPPRDFSASRSIMPAAAAPVPARHSLMAAEEPKKPSHRSAKESAPVAAVAVDRQAAVPAPAPEPELAANASPTPPAEPTPAPDRKDGVVIVVSLPSQRAYVFKDGEAWGSSRVSTGKRGKRTPVGRFTILEKRVMHHSRTYDNAPMPYMQRLTWGGVAMHAGRVPGYPASHGCIRLPRSFAKRLYDLTNHSSVVLVVNKPVKSTEEASKLS